MNLNDLKYNDKGLIPVVTQDDTTGEVLMMAWMNKEAIEKTIATKKATYFSRSRNELWVKGETSGNTQAVVSMSIDCDKDTILLKVKQEGVACHTGERTCFFTDLETGEKVVNLGAKSAIITKVFDVIISRKNDDAEKSYVKSLFAEGKEKIIEKIREEAEEFIEAATLGETEKDNTETVKELCDLIFHSLVMLGYKDISINEIYKELERRFGTSGIEEKESRKK